MEFKLLLLNELRNLEDFLNVQVIDYAQVRTSLLPVTKQSVDYLSSMYLEMAAWSTGHDEAVYLLKALHLNPYIRYKQRFNLRINPRFPLKFSDPKSCNVIMYVDRETQVVDELNKNLDFYRADVVGSYYIN